MTQRYGEPANWLPIIAVHAGFHKLPIERPDQQYWQAAVGYVELGMFQDATDQLEKVDPFNRAAPEVLAVRLAIYCGLKNGN